VSGAAGTVDELLVPLRPDRFAERAVEVMLDMEVAFHL
jgi:hypothetical protein